MKTQFVLLCLMLALLVISCQLVAPTELPTTAGKMETQVAATSIAKQAATANAEREINMTLTAAAPTTTSTPPPSLTSTPPPSPTSNIFNIRIEAAACWVNTGISLTTGQTVTISATGQANTWGGKPGSSGGPSGQIGSTCGAVQCPRIGADYGALIGRIGTGKTFFVGSHLVFTADEDGEFFLTINDWECTDNVGGFDVSITVD